MWIKTDLSDYENINKNIDKLIIYYPRKDVIINLPKLKHLMIVGDKHITRSLFMGIQNIVSLKMINCDFALNAFDDLTQLTTLKILNRAHIYSRQMLGLRNVKYLQLNNCCVDSDLFEMLENLEIVKLFNVKGISTFSTLRNIKKMICFKTLITDEMINNLTTLCELGVGGNNTLTDYAFQKLVNLTHLNVSYCRNITNSAFTNLHKLMKLEMMGCSQNGINSSSYEHLKQLEYLDILDCNSETISYKTLVKLPKLKTIFLPYQNKAKKMLPFIHKINYLKISQ